MNSDKNEQNTLWNNPMMEAARKSLTDEQKLQYRQIGEELYGNIDFESAEYFSDIAPPFTEAAAYIKESVKSGLHPSLLEENEKIILKDICGEKWYEEFGYCEEDLTDIVTLDVTENTEKQEKCCNKTKEQKDE